MQVLLCDDDRLFTENLRGQIDQTFQKYSSSCTIQIWDSGIELLASADLEHTDILFLDIDLPGLSGIKVAKQVRERNPDIYLIFLTNREDLVFTAIQFQPYRFIRKAKLSEELEETIFHLIEKIADETLLYQFVRGGSVIKLPIREIIYLESQGHALMVHHRGGVEKIRGRLSEYDTRLEKYGFVRVHNGFLVNVRYIYSIDYRGISLDDGSELPISRKRLEDVRRIHMTYMRKHIYGDY